MERGALFRHFCVSKVITTGYAHKSGVIFHFFPTAFKQTKKKIKALRPEMTKIASRRSCLNFNIGVIGIFFLCFTGFPFPASSMFHSMPVQQMSKERLQRCLSDSMAETSQVSKLSSVITPACSLSG